MAEGGYVEEYDSLYGCVRCGTIMGDIHEDEVHGRVKCEECGEYAIVSFTTALDTLNDLHLKGKIKFSSELEDF